VVGYNKSFLVWIEGYTVLVWNFEIHRWNVYVGCVASIDVAVNDFLLKLHINDHDIKVNAHALQAKV